MILGNQHKNIVNVDFHLTNKFHLKNYIVIDDFLIRLWSPHFMIKVKIAALVVLHIARGKQLIAREIVKRGKDIPHSQNCAKQCDEVFFILLPDNGLTQREFILQLGNQFFVAVVVLAVLVIALIISFIVFQQNDTSGFAVSE